MAKKNMTTRPVEVEEFVKIVKTITTGGFTYKTLDSNKKEVERVFRPNKQIALILQLQASLGLRVSDVLELRVSNFKNGKLQITEKKTGKLQYRDINSNVYNAILDHVIENKLGKDAKLFSIGVRAVQKALKIVTDHLGLDKIATHSFRKLYAVTVYENNNNDIDLLKELLNHTSIATTEKYIRTTQKAMNQASKNVNYIISE